MSLLWFPSIYIPKVFTTLRYFHLCYSLIPKWIKFIFVFKILLTPQLLMGLFSISLKMAPNDRSWATAAPHWLRMCPSWEESGEALDTGSWGGRKRSSCQPIRRSRSWKSRYELEQKKTRTQQETHSYLCLMLQIMHAFSVAPFDQNLSIDGKGLTDDSATLGSLGVVPESIICLKVTTAKLAPVSRRRRGP